MEKAAAGMAAKELGLGLRAPGIYIAIIVIDYIISMQEEVVSALKAC